MFSNRGPVFASSALRDYLVVGGAPRAHAAHDVDHAGVAVSEKKTCAGAASHSPAADDGQGLHAGEGQVRIRFAHLLVIHVVGALDVQALMKTLDGDLVKGHGGKSRVAPTRHSARDESPNVAVQAHKGQLAQRPPGVAVVFAEKEERGVGIEDPAGPLLEFGAARMISPPVNPGWEFQPPV